jgi:type VI secretion system FHA domain protein
MIVLSVQSCNGVPSVNGPSASFDELGGTIGRAEQNQLVLPDPERTISRVHARVGFRASGYFIVDNGSNPISVNGTPLGAGRECPLVPGDIVEIEGYRLAVSEAVQSTSDDPFAELFGDAGGGLVGPAASVPATSAPASGQGPARRGPAPAAPGSTAPPAGTAAWPPAPAPAATRAPTLGGEGGAGSAGRMGGTAVIPEDWDPFAGDAPPPGDSGHGSSAPALEPDWMASRSAVGSGGLRPFGDDSLDDLFGLAQVAASGDPLGAAPAQVLAQPNTAGAADPIRALARGPVASEASQADHGSELNTPMSLPRAASTAPAPAPEPKGAVFSWDDPPRTGRHVTLPGGLAQDDEALRAPSAPSARSLAASGATAPVPAPAPLAAQRASAEPVAVARSGVARADKGEAALLSAFLEGLASPVLRLDALTPERMRLVGELLRESTRGTVELLLARAALKRELRADMTMITARENNPLKFSPSVDVALQHLLGERTPGFMAPERAMRDAFDDLRAHQLGVMAGMRAALEGVLARFDPAQLEGKLTRRSALTQLIPAARKARLWELFQELFAQLQSEAQDDFDELFGRAFLRAYEEQLDRLTNERS